MTDLLTNSSPELPSSILSDAHPTPTHCGITVSNLYGWLLPTLIPMLAAAGVLLGFRALATVAVVVASAVVATLLWRLVGQRGRAMNLSHAIYLSALLALLLPAELARSAMPSDPAGTGWLLLIAAGFAFASLYWLFGGVGARLHPTAAAILLLMALFAPQLTPSATLVRPNLITGDLLISRPAVLETATIEPALATTYPAKFPPALKQESAAVRLTSFTHGNPPPNAPEGTSLSLDGLLRDRLPPLEDLILGGHPTPIGQASLAAVLFSGLLLLYRGGADWRIPVFTLISAFLAFLCLRIPVVVTPSGPIYRFLAFRDPGVSLQTLLTFASYELAAGPLVFTAFFLATSGASSPNTRRTRTLYAIILGVSSAIAQLYISVATGPLAALLVMSLFAPLFRKFLRPRPIL